MPTTGALHTGLGSRWDANLRAGQILSACCGVAALFAGEQRSVIAGVCLAVTSMCWFTVGRRSTGRNRRVVVSATPGFALLIGPVATVVLARGNLEMAFTQWFTPLISIFVIALSVQRLEPPRPFVYGLVAAALYIGSYLVAMHGVDVGARTAWALHPVNQVVRVGFFVGTGAAFAMVARSLRRSLSRAEARLRERFSTARAMSDALIEMLRTDRSALARADELAAAIDRVSGLDDDDESCVIVPARDPERTLEMTARTRAPRRPLRVVARDEHSDIASAPTAIGPPGDDVAAVIRRVSARAQRR